MDQEPDQNQNPTPSPATAPDAAKGPAYGSILGIILIVAILVAGAFYVWNERLDMNTAESEEIPAGTMPTVEGSADVEAGSDGPMPL